MFENSAAEKWQIARKGFLEFSIGGHQFAHLGSLAELLQILNGGKCLLPRRWARLKDRFGIHGWCLEQSPGGCRCVGQCAGNEFPPWVTPVSPQTSARPSAQLGNLRWQQKPCWEQEPAATGLLWGMGKRSQS